MDYETVFCFVYTQSWRLWKDKDGLTQIEAKVWATLYVNARMRAWPFCESDSKLRQQWRLQYNFTYNRLHNATERVIKISHLRFYLRCILMAVKLHFPQFCVIAGTHNRRSGQALWSSTQYHIIYILTAFCTSIRQILEPVFGSALHTWAVARVNTK